MSVVYPTKADAPPTKLSDVLFDRRTPSFANLAPLSFNVEALEAALIFSAGLANLVAIIGPSGWGKSHILSAVQGRFKAEGRPSYPLMAAAKALEEHSQFLSASPLMLDDCQEVIDGGRRRAMLRLTLEGRVRANRPTILSFTGAKASRQIRSLLPNQRAWSICVIETPNPEERIQLIRHMAEADGLTLSPALVRIMAHEMHGDGRTIAGALKRLRLTGPQWMDNLATVKACGILNAFFCDNGSWDLKHRILKLALEHKRSSAGAHPDLAAFVMLKIASLEEAEVARALGVEPAAVYFSASRFEGDLACDHLKKAVLQQLLDDLVRFLAKE